MKNTLVAFILVFSTTIFSTKITSGNYTIGNGGNYANIKAAADSVGTPLTGNLHFTIIDSMTVSAQCSIKTNLAGYTYTITSDSNHYGNYNRGHWLKYSNTTYRVVIEPAE